MGVCATYYSVSPHGLVHGLGHILHISPVEAGHANAAVLGHVDMSVLPDLQHLLLVQAREAEHADLVRDVPPAAFLAVQFLQLPAQHRSHLLDPAAHGAEVVFPLGEERGLVEHHAGDSGAVGRRVADFAPLENRQLRADPGDRVGRVRAWSGDKMKGPSPLAVQTKVFRKGLGNAELKALRDEVPYGPGVVFEVTGREALISAIEKGEMLLRSDDFRELDPLVVGGIHSGRIVCTGMQNENASRGSLLDGGDHTGEIQAFGLGGKIGIG